MRNGPWWRNQGRGVFDDIQTSQNVDLLRYQSPAMVARQRLTHLIAHNLVRLLIVQAEAQCPAAQQGRLSFKGTLDRINQWQGLHQREASQ